MMNRAGNDDLVQILGDYALTKYYDVQEDEGIGDDWIRIDGLLNAHGRVALLGRPFGPVENRFDPGRMGSYFQDTMTAEGSVLTLQQYALSEWQSFLALLRKAKTHNVGVYVTF